MVVGKHLKYLQYASSMHRFDVCMKNEKDVVFSFLKKKMKNLASKVIGD